MYNNIWPKYNYTDYTTRKRLLGDVDELPDLFAVPSCNRLLMFDAGILLRLPVGMTGTVLPLAFEGDAVPPDQRPGLLRAWRTASAPSLAFGLAGSPPDTPPTRSN